MKKGLLIALLALLADQLHKYIMIYVVGMQGFFIDGMPVLRHGGKFIEITGFSNLVMVWNRGVSFGMFNHGEVAAYQPLMLSLLALAIVTALVIWLRKATGCLQIWGIGLVIGGALGNVVDRTRYGAVADFFDFHIGAMHWPAFNIADACISIGVFMLVIESFWDIKKTSSEKTGS